MLRDENYPLEDQCLRCDANTYLLDQSNFSACLNCPVGATCAGGDDVTTMSGFWRQPDGWTNNWTTSRRSDSEGLRNDAGEIPPFVQRVGVEFKSLMQQMRRPDLSHSALLQRRTEIKNITHRPRSAIVHKCLPGDCSKDNECLRNRTGPACGLCPEGWAETSAGCEWCPPPDDPGLVLLKMAVFVIGGFVALVGYVLTAWAPLMSRLPMPDWMATAIMLALGIDPEEDEKEPDSDDDEAQTAGGAASGRASSAAADPAVVGGAGVVAGSAAQNHALGNAIGNSAAPEGRGSKKNAIAKCLAGIKAGVSKIGQKMFRVPMPKGGLSTLLKRLKKAFQSVTGAFEKFHGAIMQVMQGIKTVGGYISKIFGGMSWLSEFAEKHKLSVHLKIVISYVQVRFFLACSAAPCRALIDGKF